jgi:hypothetical protein
MTCIAYACTDQTATLVALYGEVIAEGAAT